MVTVVCQVCGKQFQAQRATKKYCSPECQNAMRRQRWAARDQTERIEKLMLEKQCVLCGNIFRPKNRAANNRTCCYDCMPDGVQFSRSDFIARLKQLRGGACQRCGYNNCLMALDFHHIDPTQKDFIISNDRIKISEMASESKKCILLCANCHRELHANLWSIDILNTQGEEEVEAL